jgi:hypothetical protein
MVLLATQVVHSVEKKIMKKQRYSKRLNVILSKYTAIKKPRCRFRDKEEESKDINQILRENEKMKEDVISNLSDKLIMLSERLDAIEKFNR